MAQDRIIKWNPALPLVQPSRVEEILKGYVSEMGTVELKGDRFFATFVGKGSQPFGTYNPYRDERWFEVWMDENSMSIITREQDPIMNSIAEGFAALIARYFQGKRED